MIEKLGQFNGIYNIKDTQRNLKDGAIDDNFLKIANKINEIIEYIRLNVPETYEWKFNVKGVEIDENDYIKKSDLLEWIEENSFSANGAKIKLLEVNELYKHFNLNK